MYAPQRLALPYDPTAAAPPTNMPPGLVYAGSGFGGSGGFGGGTLATAAATTSKAPRTYKDQLIQATTSSKHERDLIDRLEADLARERALNHTLQAELTQLRAKHEAFLLELARSGQHAKENHNQQLGFLLLHQMSQKTVGLLPDNVRHLRRTLLNQLPPARDEREWNRNLTLVEQELPAARQRALGKDLDDTVKSAEVAVTQLQALDVQIQESSRQLEDTKRSLQAAPPPAAEHGKMQETLQEAEDILQALLTKRQLLADGMRRQGVAHSTALSIRLVPS